MAGDYKPLTYQNAALTSSSIPVVENHLITNFPPFDPGIPDQFRVDIWLHFGIVSAKSAKTATPRS